MMFDGAPAVNPLGTKIIDCIDLPVLIVDQNLTVAGFNTAAATLLSLSGTDHGRSLRTLREPAGTTQVEESCAQVMATGSSQRVEVPDATGSRFSVHVGCHRSGQTVRGAVLTFSDITAFHGSLERANEEREFTRTVLDTVADALVIVDSDLRIQAANQAFYALFRTSRQDAQGTPLYRLGSGDWDVPGLRALLDGELSDHSAPRCLDCDHDFFGLGRRRLTLTARPLLWPAAASHTTLITMRDVTEHTRAIEDLRESEEELRILGRVGATLASELDLKKLVQVVTDAGRELSQAEFGAFFYNDRDEAGEKYLLYTLSGAPEEAFSHFPMPRKTDVFGPTFRGEGTVRVADIRQDPRYGKNHPHHGIPEGHLPVRSYLAVPVISRSGDVIGGLFFGHSQVAVFTERAERLVEGLARQAAVALDNAQLFEAMRSQRSRAEESQKSFRAMIETTPGCVKMVAPDGTVLHINSFGLSMLGADHSAAVVGKSVYGFIAPEHRDVYRAFNERICRGEQGSLEFDIIGLSGVRRHMETRAAPLQTSDETVVQLAVSLDVTDRKQAEQVQRRLAAIVESSGDAILSKDLNGIVTSWNPAAEKMFGYTAEEMIGRTIMTIVPAESVDDERRILATIGRGERIERFETVRLTKAALAIDVSLTVSPVRDETGTVVGAATIARDITQEKKIEMALRTTERLASVGRLAATVAHEINNPLEAITNLVYLAKCSAISDEVRKYLGTIEEELERVSHLTRQTLGFYRETKAPTLITVGSMLDSLISVLGTRARNKGVEIRREVRRDPEIHAVGGEIRQVIANLLSNSIDAVAPGGLVRIRINAARVSPSQSPGVRITVADSGPGIPTALRAKIFEPFFTTKAEVGTGLGLWVCGNIVRRHHGSIRVRTSELPGSSWTVFSVFLPSRRDVAEPLAHAPSI